MKKMILALLLALALPTLGHATMTIVDGKNDIASSATPEQVSTSTTYYNECTVCADTGNAGVAALGVTPVATANAQEGTVLSAGECRTYSGNGRAEIQLAKIYAAVATNGDDVAYECVLIS